MKKSTIVALVVFAGLGVGAWLSLEKKPERGIERASFAAVKPDSIDKLEISGKEPASVEKKDGRWVLASGRRADENTVKAALEAIPRIDTAELVSQNPDRFAALEVDDAKGTRVKASSAGKVIAEFVLGKWGAEGTYVRIGDAVWSCKGVSQWTFSRPASAWQHLKLVEDEAAEVSRIEVSLAGETPYALMKAEGAWRFEDEKLAPAGFRFDQAQATSFAAALAGLSAKEILDADPGAESTGLGKPDVVAFLGKGGARHEIHLGATVDGAVYARVAGSPDLAKLNDYVAKGLRKKVGDFRDLTLLKFDRERVKRLEIVDGKDSVAFEKDAAGWKLAEASPAAPAGFELDPLAVDRRVGMLANARALRPVAFPGKHGLDKPGASVTAVLEDGSKASLAFGNLTKESDEEVTYVRGNADAEMYFAAKFLRGQLAAGLDSFKRVERQSPQLDPSSLNGLPPEVREALLKQMAGQGAPPMAVP